MNRRQEYLKYLLEKERWTIDDEEWMLSYLERGELGAFENVAREAFNEDVASYKNVRDIRLSESALKSIHQRIDMPKPSLMQSIQLHWVKYAAAACIVLLLGWGYLYMTVFYSGSQSIPVQHVTTAATERKTIELPDGSFVSLEPGTSLDYPATFTGETRPVSLKGEAFFEVAKDAKHPFVIQTKHLKTTVLGTSFNVEAYDTKLSKVVVVTGKVKVQTDEDKQTIILTPNQSVVYNNTTGELVKKEVATEAQFYQHRRMGKFNYRGVGLDKVVEDLQRYYNTTITIEGDTKECMFYGDLFAGDQLEKSLGLIATSLNATIKKDTKNSYTIVGGHCR